MLLYLSQRKELEFLATNNYDALLVDLYKIKENLLTKENLLNRSIRRCQLDISDLIKNIQELNLLIAENGKELDIAKNFDKYLKNVFLQKTLIPAVITIIVCFAVALLAHLRGYSTDVFPAAACISVSIGAHVLVFQLKKELNIGFFDVLELLWSGIDEEEKEKIEKKQQNLIQIKALKKESLKKAKKDKRRFTESLAKTKEELSTYEQYITEITYGKNLANDLNVDNAIDYIFAYDSKAQDIAKRVRIR